MQPLLPSGHRRIERVELRGITKRFPGVIANDGVTFDVRAGEIHALLGENGAGKSTLMKTLYGIHKPDAGEIVINGAAVTLKSPSDALSQGIGMIHQHFMLVPSLTVAENAALGMKMPTLLLDLARVRADIRRLSDVYGLRIEPDAPVWSLSVGEQQRAEIVKALYRGGALLILDEPTAVLTPQEVADLFVTLKRMREQGHAIIFISHKLGEVLELADRITVLRGGKTIDTVPNVGLDQRTLALLMVGREVTFGQERTARAVGDVILSIHEIKADDDQGLPALDGVSLDVHAGEIVGIAGVSGNGQRELAETIAGMRPVRSGTVWLGERDITLADVRERLDAGLAFVPEERMKHGVIGTFSVGENSVLQTHGQQPFSRGGWIFFRAIARHAAELVRLFTIKTPNTSTPARSLSGGNIQKLILARELSRQPRLLIAAQPTRGVDVSATEYIHRVLLDQRAAGMAILLISEDLDEILALADRVAVMYEGRIVGIVPRGEADLERLGLMMAGVGETRV